MINCVRCGKPLHGSLDTWGEVYLPLCRDCYWEDQDYLEREEKALHERIEDIKADIEGLEDEAALMALNLEEAIEDLEEHQRRRPA